MGYRSDVAAVFYVKDAKHFPLLKLWLDENFPMDMYNEYIRWFDRGMVVEEEHVKWYSDFDDVKAFNEAVEKYSTLINMGLDNKDAPLFSYEFVRIGENDDDVEVEQEGNECEFLLRVERRITVDI